jgi:hypothetical protein
MPIANRWWVASRIAFRRNDCAARRDASEGTEAWADKAFSLPTCVLLAGPCAAARGYLSRKGNELPSPAAQQPVAWRPFFVVT